MINYRFSIFLLLLVLISCSPDLTVRDINAPSTVRSGMDLENMVEVTSENIGSTETGDIGYFDDLLLSSDTHVPEGLAPLQDSPGFLEDAILIGGRSNGPSLGPGESRTLVDTSLAIPEGVPAGSYFICTRLDSANDIRESNEDNNAACTQVEIDFPTDEIVPELFCIDFEQTSTVGAISGADASVLYTDLGVNFPTFPIIFHNPPLADRAQLLFQGETGSARPESSCGPLEIRIHSGLLAERITFEARNVGFISTPVEIVATAYGKVDGGDVLVDEQRIVSRSTLGNLDTFEIITLLSTNNEEITEPLITKVIVNYTTCPPHVAIDNLCITPRDTE